MIREELGQITTNFEGKMDELNKNSARVEKTESRLQELDNLMKDLQIRQEALDEKQEFMLVVEKKMDLLSNMLERTEKRINLVFESEGKVKQTQQALAALEAVINRTNIGKIGRASCRERV